MRGSRPSGAEPAAGRALTPVPEAPPLPRARVRDSSVETLRDTKPRLYPGRSCWSGDCLSPRDPRAGVSGPSSGVTRAGVQVPRLRRPGTWWLRSLFAGCRASPVGPNAALGTKTEGPRPLGGGLGLLLVKNQEALQLPRLPRMSGRGGAGGAGAQPPGCTLSPGELSPETKAGPAEWTAGPKWVRRGARHAGTLATGLGAAAGGGGSLTYLERRPRGGGAGRGGGMETPARSLSDAVAVRTEGPPRVQAQAHCWPRC